MSGVYFLFSLGNAHTHVKQNCNHSEDLGLQVYNLALPFIDSRIGLLVKLGSLDAKWSWPGFTYQGIL